MTATCVSRETKLKLLVTMANFFLVDGDEQRARGAEHLDDIDLIHSKEINGPWGPSLVAVAQRGGAHVCWQCGEPFDSADPKHRGVEVAAGFARILLHAKCVNPKTRSTRTFHDITRGLQARRFFAKAVKAVSKVLESPDKKPSEV
jgi:hypothetical protein